jgi:hypothetical protein
MALFIMKNGTDSSQSAVCKLNFVDIVTKIVDQSTKLRIGRIILSSLSAFKDGRSTTGSYGI